ncbi:uncharacterized protein LOC126382246 [Pectinophora gossypiella]|uniref:uncharacterized protein LOC126382246 n=1 Tax=Pectinophora gossypiella TaxID=13191 RepID=UPI00214F4346|nr:uncharacterized protein LOC126382246 [Pectinophora gossypiella]
MFKFVVVFCILVVNFTSCEISWRTFQHLSRVMDSRNYTCDEEHRDLMQKRIAKQDPCSHTRCLDNKIVTFKCGEIKKAYPPCRYAVDGDNPFPNCCLRIECPPYYKALDAYIYTLTLIQTNGEATLDQGTLYSDIDVSYGGSFQPFFRNKCYIFLFVTWLVLCIG